MPSPNTPANPQVLIDSKLFAEIEAIYFLVARFRCRAVVGAAPEGADCSVMATRVKGAAASLRDALTGTLDPLRPARFGAAVGAVLNAEASRVGASTPVGSFGSHGTFGELGFGRPPAVAVGRPNRASCPSCRWLVMTHRAG